MSIFHFPSAIIFGSINCQRIPLFLLGADQKYVISKHHSDQQCSSEYSILVQFKILSDVLKEMLNKILREGALLVIEFITTDKIPYDTF
jgi:hypothetical protein